MNYLGGYSWIFDPITDELIVAAGDGFAFIVPGARDLCERMYQRMSKFSLECSCDKDLSHSTWSFVDGELRALILDEGPEPEWEVPPTLGETRDFVVGMMVVMIDRTTDHINVYWTLHDDDEQLVTESITQKEISMILRHPAPQKT